MYIDEITLSDLEIFRDPEGGGGVTAMFAATETAAGRRSLHRRLRNPSADGAEIRVNQAAVRFFLEVWPQALLPPGLLDRVERYLASNIDLGERDRWFSDVSRGIWLPLREPDLCRELTQGVADCHELLSVSATLSRALLASEPPELVRSLVARLVASHSEIAAASRPFGMTGTIRGDRALRRRAKAPLREIVHCLAELDALRTMATTTETLGWAMPEIVDSEVFVLEGEGLRHPFVQDATRNPVAVTGGEPMVFLTGPNMAGKTTYLRAVGLASLLAQVGMGVPATRLRLTPVEVLLTSLNPSDNLRSGLSFFFAEVLRVKQAAQHLAEGKRCLVLFDEVFKGTNVRDALEASAAVISGFARAGGSGCVFSSHLVELADELSASSRIQFAHFEGSIVDGRATYSYELRPGVSDQRLGLQLLREANVQTLLQRIGR